MFWSSAYKPAAAKNPTCRIAPPNSRRYRTARVMRSREPARSEPPGAPSPLDSATDNRSNGAAELGHRPPARDRGIPQPGAVQIAGDIALACGGADLLDLIRRENDAARAIVGVLDADHGRRRIRHVAARLDGLDKFLSREDAPRSDLGQLHTRVGRGAPCFVPRHMALAADDDVVAGAGEQTQGDLVRHRAAWHPQRGLLSDERRHARLQQIDRSDPRRTDRRQPELPRWLPASRAWGASPCRSADRWAKRTRSSARPRRLPVALGRSAGALRAVFRE